MYRIYNFESSIKIMQILIDIVKVKAKKLIVDTLLIKLFIILVYILLNWSSIFAH